MLETDATIWATLGTVILWVCVGLGVIAFFASKRLLVGLAVAGIGVVAGGLMWNIDEDHYFDIALIKGDGGDTTPQILSDEVGGIYTFANSQSVVLRRGENDKGSFIINDSDHYAMMVRIVYGVTYSDDADEIVAVVPPHSVQYVTHRTNYMSPWDDTSIIPSSVEVDEAGTIVNKYWVTWADFEPKLGSIYDQVEPPVI